ncbi:chorismate mutase, partial [Kitasatospora sp. NPDC048296]|uniref:chorismate mutase n=1 Tax=Kitasatospora sp. NPDC048296 TaxID=3364048 RepID=UPI003721358E
MQCESAYCAALDALTAPSRVDERQDELAELDRSLIRMIRRRAELVGAIEAERRAAGLPRTELTRENRMLQEWKRLGSKIREFTGGEDVDIVFEHPGRETFGASVYVTRK